MQAGTSIYTLDEALIRRIDPDVILTQDLCRVCAIPSAAVEDALAALDSHATVVSLDPHRLAEVIDCVGAVGAATGPEARATQVMDGLRGRRHQRGPSALSTVIPVLEGSVAAEDRQS